MITTFKEVFYHNTKGKKYENFRPKGSEWTNRQMKKWKEEGSGEEK